MAAVFPSEAMQRLDAMRTVTIRPDVLSAEPDPVKPGGWIVRNEATPHRIELVNAEGCCSCIGFAVQGYCKHAALVANMVLQLAT